MNNLYVRVPKYIFVNHTDDELDSYISNVVSRYNKNKISSVEISYSTLHEMYNDITMGSYDYASSSNLTFRKFCEKYNIPECPYFIDDEMELFEYFEISENNPHFNWSQGYLDTIFGFFKSKRKYILGKNVTTIKVFSEKFEDIPPNPIVIDHTSSIFHKYFGYRGDYIFDSHSKFVEYSKKYLNNYSDDFIVSLNVK